MQVDILKKPLAFRLNYLLGGDEMQIHSDFLSDYKESNNFKYFENYVDARTLRTLVKLRSSVFKDYDRYSKRKQKELSNYTDIDTKDISYLKQNNIPIEKIFNELGIVDYVNALTYMIDVITFKVLVDLEIPYSDEITSYFKYPKFTHSSLKEYVDLCQDILVPRGIYFYGMDKIKATLKYAMNNDMNCIFSAFSLEDKAFNGVAEIPTFEYRKTLGEDLDSNAVIDVDKIMARINEENMAELERVKTLEKEAEDRKKAEAERIVAMRLEAENRTKLEAEKKLKQEAELEDMAKKRTKPSVIVNKKNNVIDSKFIKPIVDNKKVVSKPIKTPVEISKVSKNIVHPSVITDKPIMVVDCHNVNFFNFMCYLNKYGEKFIEKVVLVCDFKSNMLWNFVDKLFANMNIEKVDCVNIEDSMGNTDVVLTHEVSKYVYNSNAKNISIVSNATSFYNLFDLVSGVKMQICTETPNKLPMDYLKSYDVSVFTITTTIDKCGIDFMSNDLTDYSVMYSLVFNPLIYSSKQLIVDYVREHLGGIIPLTTIENSVDKVLTDTTIKINGAETTVISGKKSVVIKS